MRSRVPFLRPPKIRCDGETQSGFLNREEKQNIKGKNIEVRECVYYC